MNTKKLFKAGALVSAIALLSACGAIDANKEDDHDHDSETETKSQSVNLPDGKTLIFVDSTSAQQYQYNSTTDKFEDLNEHANSSTDESVRNLKLSDTATIGQFFIWADDSDGDGKVNEEKLVLLKPSVTSTTELDHNNIQYIAHYHDSELAAHLGSEFNPADYGSNWQGSKKQKGLERLNKAFDDYGTLFTEVKEALESAAADQVLCRAYIDPHGEEEEHTDERTAVRAEEAHEHHEKVHYALTQSGRMYFFEEENESLKLKQQSFVALDGVSTIANCNNTAITRASEDGVLVYVPDSQKVYLVDSHEADFHQHSQWKVADFMPSGFSPNMMAAIGEGESDHDDHDMDDDHDH